MSIPVVFGIYGDSDSGKTTLVVHLVTQLAEKGYRVATVKQTQKAISMDTKNKDTWRHHNAGASLVVFSSRCETDFLFHEKQSTTEIIKSITDFGDFDVILIEGADDPTIPKIQVGSGRKRKHTILNYKGDVNGIVAHIIKERQQPLSASLRITVDGEVVPLSEFPTQMITRTIVAQLGCLKGVQEFKKVDIHLRR